MTTLKRNEPIVVIHPKEDETLFGATNEKLADLLADRIRDMIKEGVRALPLLSDPEKSADLRATVEDKYIRSVDVIEAYGDRNIFTIRQHPPRRRKLIAAAFRQTDKENGTHCYVACSTTLTQNHSPNESFQYPSGKDIPSDSDIAALRVALHDLKDQIQKAQNRRKELLVQNASIETARTVGSQALATLQKTNGIQECATSIVIDGQCIQDLAQHGKQVVDDLESTRKSLRDVEDNLVLNSLTSPIAKKKRLGLEDQYREDRQQVVTSMDSLAAVIGHFKKP